MSDHSHHHHPHHEDHGNSSAGLRDFVLGLSDGLTVPFALVAGLSGAIDNTQLVVVAGVAEIAAGAISMGLGGYLAAKTERDYYFSEQRREAHEVKTVPHVEAKEVADILTSFGVPDASVPVVVEAISHNPKKWVEFMMKFELGLEKPDAKRLWQSPIIIGGAYIIGGLVPLTPYILFKHTGEALNISIACSLIALFAFGAFKGRSTGQPVFKAALQTTVIGALAAACAYGLAKLVSM